MRTKLALLVLAGAMLTGAAARVKDSRFTIKPGKGTDIGLSLRTDRHIALGKRGPGDHHVD